MPAKLSTVLGDNLDRLERMVSLIKAILNTHFKFIDTEYGPLDVSEFNPLQLVSKIADVYRRQPLGICSADQQNCDEATDSSGSTVKEYTYSDKVV